MIDAPADPPTRDARPPSESVATPGPAATDSGARADTSGPAREPSVPARAPGGAPVEILERGLELELLADAVDHADRGRIVVLRGEPGTGRTTLLDAAAERARTSGVRVVRGRGWRLEATFAWGGLRQLLPGALEDLPDDAPVPPPTDPAVDGAGRVPSPRHPGGVFADAPAGVSSRRLEVADRAYWRLCDLATDGPVLLLLDDAQWLDEATLQLACYLAHRIQDTGLSLVVAAHDRADGPRDRLLDDLAHAPVARLCELRPLSAGATRALLHAALPSEDAAAYADACHEVSGGNPLLTTELARELQRATPRPRAASAALVAELRPPRVTRSVASRLASVPPGVRDVVEALAVLGGGTETYILAAVAGTTTESTTVLVDLAADAHLLARGRPPDFVHPLVEAAVLGGLDAGRRSVLHARAYEAIRAVGGDVSALATHLLRAEPAGRADVVDALRRAARRAAEAGDPSTAESLLRRAARERAADDPDVEEDLGRLLLGGERHRSGVRRLERARALHEEPRRRTAIDLLLAGAHFQRGDTVLAVAVLDRGLALEEHGPGDDLREQLAGARLAITGAGSDIAPPDPDAVHAATARPPRQATPVERLAWARIAVRDLHVGDAGSDRVVALARAAWAGGLDPSTHALDAITLPSAALCLTCADDLAFAEARLDEELARAAAAGEQMALANAAFLRGIARLGRGALTPAVDDWQVALDAAAEGWVFALPACRALRAFAALDRDELATIPALLRLPGGDGPWAQHPSFPYVLFVRGLHAAAEGRTAEGLRLVLEAGAEQTRRGIVNPALLPWQEHAALLAHELGRADHARDLAEDLRHRAEAFGTPRTVAVARRTSALTGLGDPGALLPEAVAAFEVAGTGHEVARTLLALGRWHRTAGRTADARAALREALERADAAGAAGLVRRAAEELSAAGGRPRRMRTAGSATLTSGERRVAEMAASGLTNRAIAQELFVTLRTVESHLTRVYAKLGTTRPGLPDALAQEVDGPPDAEGES